MRIPALALLLTACSGGAPDTAVPAAPPVAEAPAEAAPAEAAPAEAAPAEAAPAPEAAAVAADAVTVVTVKKGTIEDTHTMAVDASTLTVATPWDPSTLGGSLTIRTDSWDSPIDLRDGRVKELFFKTAEQATATLEVSAVEGFGPLEPGARAEGVVKGVLKVLAGSMPVEAKVAIARAEAGLAVTVVEPITVTASALGLSEGLQAVIGACGVEVADATTVTAAFTIPQG
jgi:nucleoid-associated protein YgaU